MSSSLWQQTNRSLSHGLTRRHVSSESIRRILFYIVAWLIGTTFLLSPKKVAAFQSTDKPAVIAKFNITHLTPQDIGSIAHDPNHKKFYLGVRTYHAGRTSLWVYDLDGSGNPQGKPRKYADSNESLTPGHWTWPAVLKLDPTRRKLYLGVAESHNETANTLGAYDLDETGEPRGEVRSFDSGNPLRAIQAITRHPQLNRLYYVGWGGAAVYSIDLDTEGWPHGIAVAQPFGSYGKYALAFHTDGKRLTLGTYPSALETVDLDADGRITSPPRTRAIPSGPQAYLTFAAGNRGLYFPGPDGKLAWWPLDANGEPADAPRLQAGPIIESLPLDRVTNELLVGVPFSERDTLNGELKVTGTQLVKIPLAGDGAPGDAVPMGEPALGRKTGPVTTTPGIALVLTAGPTGFQVNRTRGVELRATLQSIEANRPLPPAIESFSMGKESKYLKFVVSQPFRRLYSVVDGVLQSVALEHSQLTSESITSLAITGATGPVIVDDERRRLFVALDTGKVIVVMLDEHGMPTPASDSWETSVMPIAQLALRPTDGRVFVLGPKIPGKTAHENIIPLETAAMEQTVIVDMGFKRIYSVSNYHGNENLAVWKLDASGNPEKANPNRYTDPFSRPFRVRRGGAWEDRAPIARRGTIAGLQLDSKRRKLYVGGCAENPQGNDGFITIYTLDENGDPRDEATPPVNDDFNATPRVYLAATKTGAIQTLSLDLRQGRLWEAGWGATHVFAWKLDERGEVLPDPAAYLAGEQGKYEIRFADNNRQLLLGTYPSRLERIRVAENGSLISGTFAEVNVNDKTIPLPFLVQGVPSPWMSLDEALRGGVGRTAAKVVMKGADIRTAKLKIEIRLMSDESKPAAERAFELNLAGTTGALVVPRLGEIGSANYLAQVRSSAELFREFEALARKHMVSPAHRPQKFVIANGLIGIDSDINALEAGLQTLELLGHNTSQIWNWPGVAGETIAKRANEHGFRRTRGAIYNPPSYFDYERDKVEPAFLDRWGAEQLHALTAQGSSPQQVELFHLADEPGWYYPQQLHHLAETPERLVVFHDYLKAKGLTPNDVGQADWNSVRPMPQSQAQPLPQRRLHYWTARFFAESLSRSFAAATAALQRQSHSKLLTTTNLNNWPGRFYIASPGQPIANNTDRGPDAAMGMPDWFDLGRKRGVSCLWTEDWFSDQDSGQWSLYADLMRSATRGRDMEYGGYIVGHTTGHAGVPDGGAMKMLALMGHGAKVIDPYIFGPNLAFSDGWSDNEATYRSLSRGIELLGRAEPLLYPGRPRRSQVAIVFPQASQVWDRDSRVHEWMYELYGLHAALMHSNIQVDFLDDYSLEEGDLTTGKYRAVFVTAPNLSRKALQQLDGWVAQGGILALFPGACEADEYNEPTPGGFRLAGRIASHPRQPAIPLHELASAKASQVVVTATATSLIPPTAKLGNVDTPHPISAINSPSGKVLATTATGTPTAVLETVGKGQVIHFGFWPGATFWSSPSRSDPTRLPQNWSSAARAWVALVPRLANVQPEAACNISGVETALLESKAGTAVTVLNWTGKPRESISVTIRGITTPPKLVRSAWGHPISSQHQGTELKVTMPLETVDVLMMEQ